MAVEIQASDTAKFHRKRKSKHNNKASKTKKKSKREFYQEPKGKGMNSRKMKKLFKKRVKEYNSDDEDDHGDGDFSVQPLYDGKEGEASDSSEVHGHGEAEDLDVGSENGDEGNGDCEDEISGSQHELTKFTEGCKAFRMAFLKIMKKNISKDPLGPFLSDQKKLIAEKLAQEEAKWLRQKPRR